MRHCDSELHVTGRSEYTDDVAPPHGLLHGVVFGSPIAHGNIQKLDTTAALAMEGVRGVYSYDDIPATKIIGAVVADEPLFAHDKVMYIGHPLALIVADTVENARKALKVCKVKIDPLPVTVCPREAYATGELHQPVRVFQKGDVDAVWDQCDFVVEGKVDLAGQDHLYLETNRARSVPGEDGLVKVYSSTQSPSAAQKWVAAVLGIPMHKVEIDVKRLGGGFGGKEDQATHWACMASIAAVALNTPVQIVLNRVEDMRMTGKRHPYKQDFKMGLTKDGKILALDLAHYQNSGAYVDLSPPVLERTVLHSTNCYAIPNVKILAAACRTHLVPNTAFRGFGGPQGMFPTEAAIYKAAIVMGVTPEWIQAKNLIEDGYQFHYGQVVEASTMKRTWLEATELFDLEGMKQRIASYNDSHRGSKKGYAVMPVCFGISFTKTFLNQGSSLVHVYTDGSVSVTTGGIEMGQGVSSNMIAIVSRLFGISHKRVRCNSTNTSRIANISPSAASATSDLNGNATILACEEILVGLKDVAAKELGGEPDDISIQDGLVYLKGEASKLDWDQLVLKTYFARVKLMAHGFYTPPGLHYDFTKDNNHPFHYYTYGTCYIESTVDCLRGTYTIDSAKLVHDLGRGIIRSVDLGQIEGGLAQGIGWVTLEELAFNDEGRLLSHALSTYKAPDGDFLPDDIQVKFLENADNPGGPLGSKAVGEPPFMYGIAAYFALQRAIDAFKIKISDEVISPMTPERVLLSLYDKDNIHLKQPTSV
ncbi:MAG: molybdopterin-dependent oxidoreductase [Verrucomicrobia bacterium]|nr:molybdopterin-dependent oxidoreductase [Verrucomicrobiota bacterium]MDA1066951.1 molybdopterin-dependent oxidoreductase [Verrucomicrobiota bacterium]